MNNIHDKVFDCPKCFNRTLVPVEEPGILGYGTIFICEECAAELHAIHKFDGTLIFTEIVE